MKKQSFCTFILGGVNLTEYGLKIPSNFTSLTLDNAEVDSMTSWTLNVAVMGDASQNVNIAAFEALIYSAAQSAEDAAGIPVSFMFGWLDDQGNVESYLSYQGFTLQYSVSTSGQYMSYKLIGYASIAVQTQLPVLNIPALSGIVQPSAVVEGLAKAVGATYYYDLDIDHNDAPTLVSHGNLTTSFNRYVGGTYDGKDNYDAFPGLLKLSKSYNGSRDSAGLDHTKSNKLSTVLNHASNNVSNYLKGSWTDKSFQSTSFSYWVEEPTMTSKGIIHYKSNAGMVGDYTSDILQYGTSHGNILSLQGSYDGVAYNMTDMNFKSVGFAVSGSGVTISNQAQVVNSWSSSLGDVFQSANIINDVNALASQFSGDFTVTLVGATRTYEIAQPVSLIVMSGNTLSPISGIYNIVAVSHQISVTYVTVLKLQRLVMSSANEVAASQGILVKGSSSYPKSTYSKTNNIISTGKVNFGEIFPTFRDMKVK